MGFSQSTFVFFSSISVMLIAIDRLLMIVFPSVSQISNPMVRNISWFSLNVSSSGLSSLLLCSPLVRCSLFSRLHRHQSQRCLWWSSKMLSGRNLLWIFSGSLSYRCIIVHRVFLCFDITSLRMIIFKESYWSSRHGQMETIVESQL